MEKHGYIVVVEGIDRSGKGTLITELVKWADTNNYTTKCFKFPNRETTSGQQIDRYLKKQLDLTMEEANALFYNNLQQDVQSLKQAAEKTDFVFVDRYFLSFFAYGLARFTTETDKKKFLMCYFPSHGDFPSFFDQVDLFIYLAAKPEEVVGRENFGKEITEEVEYLTRVSDNFDELFSSLYSTNELDQKKLTFPNKTKKQWGFHKEPPQQSNSILSGSMDQVYQEFISFFK